MLTPNPDALAAFHQAYATMTALGSSAPPSWTVPDCLELGKLFRRAYGTPPPQSWCTPGCHLPAMVVLKTLFGSYKGYLEALEEYTCGN